MVESMVHLLLNLSTAILQVDQCRFADTASYQIEEAIALNVIYSQSAVILLHILEARILSAHPEQQPTGNVRIWGR
jgi:hypothetical protein